MEEGKQGNSDNLLTPKEWLATNFSLQYHPWITHEGHKNKGFNHQLKKPLIEMYREQYGEFAYWGVFKGYQPLQQGLNLTTTII